MAAEHIVVDGSNIATEGRSQPSLAQLEEAVAELRREYADSEVTVIVDATFSHRIDPSELPRFEEAALAGDYVQPPAGAIGRGDAFLLRVAERVDGIVLSNDSFQEFHGEHPWLFERGRLMGATPVPGVGWIFTPRSPVRGPKSRKAVRDDERAKKKISKAIAAATKEAVNPRPAPAPKRGEAAAAVADGPQRKARAATHTPAAVNAPLSFISFIADHPLGAEVDGQVDSYTSHGAVVVAEGTQCYIPLANLAVPPPRSAREVLKRGEHRRFVVTALDPQRRGVELALPGVGVVSGRPSEDMIAAELRLAKKSARAKAPAPAKKKAPAATPAPAPAPAKKKAPALAPTAPAKKKAPAPAPTATPAPAKKKKAPALAPTAPAKKKEAPVATPAPAKKKKAPALAPTAPPAPAKKRAPAPAPAPTKKKKAPALAPTAPAKKKAPGRVAVKPGTGAAARPAKAAEPVARDGGGPEGAPPPAPRRRRRVTGGPR